MGSSAASGSALCNSVIRAPPGIDLCACNMSERCSVLRRDGQRVLGHTFLRGSIVKQYECLCTRPIAFAYTEISARGATAATMVLVWCVGERSSGASWTMVWPSLLVCALRAVPS